MSKKTEFRVVREHEGDRFYATGDIRTAALSDVKHLIPHVLEEIGPAADEPEEQEDRQPEEKADAATENKAEASAPENKAITAPRRKGK